MDIRACRRTDLAGLEWEGEYAHDRPIIAATYAASCAGSCEMLVAEDAGVLVGQIWIDLGREPATATLWALRVRAPWRGRGVGTRLIAAAERAAAARGATIAELEVEPSNEAARRLYERLGYAHVRTELARDPAGGRVRGPALLVLRKRLAAAPAG